MRVMVYDKALRRIGTLGAPDAVTVTKVANGIGAAEVTVKGHHDRVPAALAAGARLVIDQEGMPPFSGVVRKRAGAGPAQAGKVTLTCVDDARILGQWLAWPAPSKPIGTQGQATAKYTGTAEAIAKAVLNANRGRFPEKVTVAPDLGRGKVIPGGVTFRWHPIMDRLLPAFEQAGLVFDIVQVGGSIVVDVREQRRIRRPLSTASGNLVSWEWTDEDPMATRVVVGGQGSGEMRNALQKIDAAREAEYGYVVEKFIDARDTDQASELTGRMDEALAEGAPAHGLSIDLATSEGFVYGKDFLVGDLVTVDLGGVVRTDVLRSVTVSWTREGGLARVAPSVGDAAETSNGALRKLVRSLQKSVNDLKVSH